MVHVKELLEGRSVGFALRPAIGLVALGLGLGALLLDAMTWFQWGARDTNGIYAGAHWLVSATAIVALLATITAAAEQIDVPEEERGLARLDVGAMALASLLYAVSSFARALFPGAAAATPAAALLALAGLIVLVAAAALAGNLYASREWAVIEEEEEAVRERGGRRRLATR